MPSPFRLFRAGSPIGPGFGLPRRGVRRQIADIVAAVDGPPASGGGSDQAEEFFNTLRNFQKRRNLMVDGIVNPGGPTEGALNAFAVVNEKGGPKMVKAIVPALDDLTRQGLTFTADPRNPDALGMWRDAKGNRVDPEQAGRMLTGKYFGAADLDGKQQLIAERMFGKGGVDSIITTNNLPEHLLNKHGPDTGTGSGGEIISGGEGGDVLGNGNVGDSTKREDRFTSGALRRTADKIANDTERSRKENEAERKQERDSRRSHRDIDKIDWEAQARRSKLTDRYAAKVKDAIRVDLESDALLGIDGLRYTVDWKPLGANGQVIPEFQRPRSRKPEYGGHVAGRFFGGRSSRIFVAPYPHPHGFRVEVKVPPQQSVNGNTPGAHLNIFVPKGEFVSEERVR